MKNIIIAVVLLAGINANAFLKSKQLINYNKIQSYTKAQAMGSQSLLWLVGEQTEYALSLLSLPAGTVTIEVAKKTKKGFLG